MNEAIENSATVFDSQRERDQIKLLQIEKSIRANITDIKRKIYDIGKLLSEAKKILPHGQFQRWIEETFGGELPYSTAALYKDIYDHFKDKPEMVRYIPVSLLLFLKQKEFPEQIINLIEEDPEGYAKVVDIQAFKRTYADYKKGKKTIYDFWADTGEDVNVAFALLRDKKLARQFDNTQKTIRLGFSEIDKGIRLVKNLSQLPPPALRDYYNKQFDKRIDMLQKAKAAFNDIYLSDRKVSNL